MKRVGRHTIVREIAGSGALTTFEATHDDGRAVRLRVFAAGFDPDDLAVERFEEELSQVAALRHPGIDRPIAWSSKDPVHVSTLHARGPSMRKLCDDAPSGRIAFEVVAGVGADVAQALQAAHSAGLVHAGLSLDSIMLGTDGRARVTDFGVMRVLNERSSAYMRVIRGSIESVSPEQLSAPETVGPGTDVFGLGLVLYRGITGKPAFDAASALGMSIRLSMGKPTPLESHGVEIPGELRELVMKMLAAVPADRPPLDHVARTLAENAGSWRETVRHLAMSAAPRAQEASSEAPSTPGLSGEPAPDAPPRGGAPSSADTETPRAAPRPEPGSTPVQRGPESPPVGARSPFVLPGDPPIQGASSASSSPSAPPPPAFAAPFHGAAPTVAESARGTGRPSQLDGGAFGSFDLATQPELELPEERGPDHDATLFELRSPAEPDDEFAFPDEEGVRSSGGDTSVWPTSDHAGDNVPKTLILEAPGARTPAPRRSVPRPKASAASLPPQLTPEAELPAPPPEPTAGAPAWAIWAAIALCAFALLVGTTTLVILVTG